MNTILPLGFIVDDNVSDRGFMSIFLNNLFLYVITNVVEHIVWLFESLSAFLEYIKNIKPAANYAINIWSKWKSLKRLLLVS